MSKNKVARYTLSILPPSVNAMYSNVPRVGRVKSKDYKKWIKEASLEILPDLKPIAGDFSVSIYLPTKMRGDIDNRIKAIIDLLVSTNATQDDCLMQSLYVERCTDGLIVIRVSEYNRDTKGKEKK